MEDPNSTLLPYILETLARKPESCDTFDHLCRDIKEVLDSDSNHCITNVRSSLQEALNVGESLGILTLTNETVRMPFSFHSKGGASPAILKAMSIQAQPPIGTGNPPVTERTGGGHCCGGHCCGGHSCGAHSCGGNAGGAIIEPKVPLHSMQNQRSVSPNYGNYNSIGAARSSGGFSNDPSSIIVGPPPVPIPMSPRRRIKRPRTTSRSRTRSRGRSRSALRRRRYGRKRPSGRGRMRSRSNSWGRRR